MEDLNEELLKNAPPVGVSTLSLLGIPLSDFVYLMTILYIFIQIICIIIKTYVSVKGKEDE